MMETNVYDRKKYLKTLLEVMKKHDTEFDRDGLKRSYQNQSIKPNTLFELLSFTNNCVPMDIDYDKFVHISYDFYETIFNDFNCYVKKIVTKTYYDIFNNKPTESEINFVCDNIMKSIKNNMDNNKREKAWGSLISPLTMRTLFTFNNLNDWESRENFNKRFFKNMMEIKLN